MIEQTTGWKLNDKDGTDDRLGRLMEVLGQQDKTLYEFQSQLNQRIISGYQLPTAVARYDTTSFNVHHQPDNPSNGLLKFGFSKDHRPDLLQYK